MPREGKASMTMPSLDQLGKRSGGRAVDARLRGSRNRRVDSATQGHQLAGLAGGESYQVPSTNRLTGDWCAALAFSAPRSQSLTSRARLPSLEEQCRSRLSSRWIIYDRRVWVPISGFRASEVTTLRSPEVKPSILVLVEPRAPPAGRRRWNSHSPPAHRHP